MRFIVGARSVCWAGTCEICVTCVRRFRTRKSIELTSLCTLHFLHPIKQEKRVQARCSLSQAQLRLCCIKLSSLGLKHFNFIMKEFLNTNCSFIKFAYSSRFFRKNKDFVSVYFNCKFMLSLSLFVIIDFCKLFKHMLYFSRNYCNCVYSLDSW